MRRDNGETPPVIQELMQGPAEKHEEVGVEVRFGLIDENDGFLVKPGGESGEDEEYGLLAGTKLVELAHWILREPLDLFRTNDSGAA